MYEFVIGGNSGPTAIADDLLDGMFHLRWDVFHDRLNWVPSGDNGRECDEYDDCDATYVIGYDADTRTVLATWRLRPTTARYMLRNTFPELLIGDAPSSPPIYEISRFGIARNSGGVSRVGEFRSLTQTLFAHSIEFGVERGVHRALWVTTLGIERMTRKLGFSLRRMGRSLQIGSCMAVTQELELDNVAVATAEKILGRAIGTVRAAA